MNPNLGDETFGDDEDAFSLFVAPPDFGGQPLGEQYAFSPSMPDFDMDSPHLYDRFSPFPRSENSYGAPSPMFDRRGMDTPSRGSLGPLEGPPQLMEPSVGLSHAGHSHLAAPTTKRFDGAQFHAGGEPPAAAMPQLPVMHSAPASAPHSSASHGMSPLTANLYLPQPYFSQHQMQMQQQQQQQQLQLQQLQQAQQQQAQQAHGGFQDPNLWPAMNILTSVAENVEQVAGDGSSGKRAATAGQEPQGPSVAQSHSTGTSGKGIDGSKRQKRLERNRKSAQASRKRKKDTMVMAERRVRELTREVDCLRQKIAERAEVTLWNQRKSVLQDLERLLEQSPDERSPADLAKLAHGVIKLTGQYGINIPERRVIRDYIFTAISHTLLPPQQYLFLWLSTLSDDFLSKIGSRTRHSDDAPMDGEDDAFLARSKAMWKHMCTEVGITKEQATKLAKRLKEKLAAPGARDRLQHLVDATVAVENLRRAVLARAVAIQEQLEHLRSVLKPEQIIRYLSWNERNRDKLRCGFISTMGGKSDCSNSNTPCDPLLPSVGGPATGGPKTCGSKGCGKASCCDPAKDTPMAEGGGIG